MYDIYDNNYFRDLLINFLRTLIKKLKEKIFIVKIIKKYKKNHE